MSQSLKIWIAYQLFGDTIMGNTPIPTPIADLRSKAEKLAGNVSISEIEKMSAWDVKKLVQELQVYHVELEMQNAQIIQSTAELEKTRNKYVNLFDTSPVGYATLDKRTGLISEANLAMTQHLSLKRSDILGKRFENFVAPENKAEFYEFFKNIFALRHKQMCELYLVPQNGQPFYVRIEGVESIDSVGNARYCQVAVLDIDDRRNTEKDLVKRVQDFTAEIEYGSALLKNEIRKRKEIEAKLREEIELLKQS